METIYAKVEMYFPVRSKEGLEVEEEKYNQTANELAIRFLESGVIKHECDAIFYSKGEQIVDIKKVFEIEVNDSKESKKWLMDYKHDTLRHRFNDEILVTFNGVELDIP